MFFIKKYLKISLFYSQIKTIHQFIKTLKKQHNLL